MGCGRPVTSTPPARSFGAPAGAVKPCGPGGPAGRRCVRADERLRTTADATVAVGDVNGGRIVVWCSSTRSRAPRADGDDRSRAAARDAAGLPLALWYGVLRAAPFAMGPRFVAGFIGRPPRGWRGHARVGDGLGVLGAAPGAVGAGGIAGWCGRRQVTHGLFSVLGCCGVLRVNLGATGRTVGSDRSGPQATVGVVVLCRPARGSDRESTPAVRSITPDAHRHASIPCHW